MPQVDLSAKYKKIMHIISFSRKKIRAGHLCLHNYPNCRKGLVFCTRSYANFPEQNITFIPLYFAFSASYEARV
jgi:hypothetical protein